MVVLGIETSCDETALALVEDGRRVLASQVASSLASHERYGGVVPEIASRAHVESFTYALEALVGDQSVPVDRIAVTYGPGLAGSLVVGMAAAKALSLAWRKDLVGVNHLQAHLYAALMGDRSETCPPSLDAPMIGLVISGGHTALVQMDGIRRYRLLGQTRDDAVGEAFDKVAKLLGLKFPGGPEIERVAQSGNPKAHRFSVPKIKGGTPFDFSYSGIKTAVLYKVRELQKGTGDRGQKTEVRREGSPLSSVFYPLPSEFVADLAASFQSFIVEEVVAKTFQACRTHRIDRLVVGGGVVANRFLRKRLQETAADLKIDLAIPALSLCTDNGAMVAGLAAHLEPVEFSKLTTVPDLKVEEDGWFPTKSS